MGNGVEDGGKALHPFFEQRFDGVRRHVAAGEARAARGDDDIHIRTGYPAFHRRADFLDIVGDNGAVREQTPGLRQPFS